MAVLVKEIANCFTPIRLTFSLISLHASIGTVSNGTFVSPLLKPTVVNRCGRLTVVDLEPLHVVTGDVKNIAVAALQFQVECAFAAADLDFTVVVLHLLGIHGENNPFVSMAIDFQSPEYRSTAVPSSTRHSLARRRNRG